MLLIELERESAMAGYSVSAAAVIKFLTNLGFEFEADHEPYVIMVHPDMENSPN